MNAPDSPSSDDRHGVAATAAAWLARRDRGFTATEQDAYLQWLQADARHRSEVARIERSWQELDSLAAWQPADGAAPNPDLLAPALPSRRRFFRRCAAVAGVGLAAALAVFLWPAAPRAPETAISAPAMRVIPRPEPQALADGSVAEIKHGGKLEVAFVTEERRVRLRAGEVHLTVAKDAARPFVVEAGGVIVRAVGTAFSVRWERDTLDVLVTEGSVQVEPPTGAPVAVSAGESAHIGARMRPVIAVEKPETIERALVWRTMRLEFEGLPLATVVAEFNLRNTLQLALGDAGAGRV